MESAFRQGADDPDLRLIETLRWDGVGFPRLALHLARLAGSAVRLGWRCEEAVAEAALRAAVSVEAGRGGASGGAGSAARVRLAIDACGECAVTVAPMPGASAVWRVGLAAARLHSADPWLTVKSTRRAAYDAARAALPEGLDEVVFLNERGEVCDGTITTVFFDRGQGMRTPPLSSGLLPGVLRGELACPEEVLGGTDLPHVRLWVGNSLRGLIPAEWVG